MIGESDVSLIVLPRTSGTTPLAPQYLLERRGAWRDLSVSPQNDPILIRTTRDQLNAELTNLQATLNTHADDMDNPNVRDDIKTMLKTACMDAYRNLAPDPVRAALKDIADATAPNDFPLLRIHQHKDMEWIPWEIMHDGTNYLGLRFQIVRIPITAEGPAPDHTGAYIVRRIGNLLGQEVLDTQSLSTEWEKTFADFKPKATEERKPNINTANANDWPTFAVLSDWLNEVSDNDARILHITCHGDLFKWTLKKGSTEPWIWEIKVKNIRNHLSREAAANLLVFCNACESAGANQTDTDPSLASELFEKGVPAFIGTTARITKRMAVNFAHRFYQHLLGDELPVSQALTATKRDFQNENGGDPTWLFYCLYGLPKTQFKLAP